MKKRKLKPMQIIHRNILVMIASKTLGLSPSDIARIFGVSRQAVYDMHKGTELSQLEYKK